MENKMKRNILIFIAFFLSSVNLLAMQVQEVNKHEFKKGKRIAVGAFGHIYKGKYDSKPIAIKVFYMMSLPAHLKFEFDSYALLRHPSLVSFYAICTTPGNFAMLMERMPESLRSFLAKRENGSLVDNNTGFLYVPNSTLLFNPIKKTYFDPKTGRSLDPKDQGFIVDPYTKNEIVIEDYTTNTEIALERSTIYDIAEQIAGGIDFLHRKKVPHKHFKSNNIFITKLKKGYEVKIGDWGLSKIKLESSSCGASTVEATVRWRAPETFSREYARIKDMFETQAPVDIYAFGVLLWELPNKGLIPYHDKSEVEVVRALSVGDKEQIDPKWPILYQWLIEDCWNDYPALRPSGAEAGQKLRKMKKGNHFHVFALRELGLSKDIVQYLVWFIHVPEHLAQMMKEITLLDAIKERSEKQDKRLEYLKEKHTELQNK